MALLHEGMMPRIPARLWARTAAAVAVAIGLWAPGIAQPRDSDSSIRIRGEVVETACFIMGDRRGPEHEQCAIACARSGASLGVLDEKTKQLYVAILDRRAGAAESPLLPFIAHRVEVRGELLEFGELPAMSVSEVRSLGLVR